MQLHEHLPHGLRQKLRDEGMVLREECMGSHHEQLDLSLRLEHHPPGQPSALVAYLDYSLYDGVPSIHMIRCLRPRRGWATVLVEHLQRMNPNCGIRWGHLVSPEAVAWHASLPFETTDSVHKADFERLADLEKEKSAASAMICPGGVFDPTAWSPELAEKQLRLEDEIDGLRWTLRDRQPTFQRLRLPEEINSRPDKTAEANPAPHHRKKSSP